MKRRIMTVAAALALVLSAAGPSLAGFQVYVANYSATGGTGGNTLDSFSETGANLGTFASGLNEPLGIAVGAAAVPEPSSLLLMGLGAAGTLAFTWRRQGAGPRRSMPRGLVRRAHPRGLAVALDRRAATSLTTR